jgi:hypothetical protein
MTKDEALKLALSTLDEVRQETFRLMKDSQTLYSEKKVWEAIYTIKKVLAQPEQEPVAVKHMMRWVDNLKWQSDNGQHMNIPSGLSSGTCWELAIELENFIKYTNSPQIAINPETVGYVAPQRRWVGLTLDDIPDDDTNNLDFYRGGRWAERVLKEKNNG